LKVIKFVKSKCFTICETFFVNKKLLKADLKKDSFQPRSRFGATGAGCFSWCALGALGLVAEGDGGVVRRVVGQTGVGAEVFGPATLISQEVGDGFIDRVARGHDDLGLVHVRTRPEFGRRAELGDLVQVAFPVQAEPEALAGPDQSQVFAKAHVVTFARHLEPLLLVHHDGIAYPEFVKGLLVHEKFPSLWDCGMNASPWDFKPIYDYQL